MKKILNALGIDEEFLKETRKSVLNWILGALGLILLSYLALLAEPVQNLRDVSLAWLNATHQIHGWLIAGSCLLAIYLATKLVVRVAQLATPRCIENYYTGEYDDIIWRWAWLPYSKKFGPKVDSSCLLPFCRTDGTELELTDRSHETEGLSVKIACVTCGKSRVIIGLNNLRDNTRKRIEGDARENRWQEKAAHITRRSKTPLNKPDEASPPSQPPPPPLSSKPTPVSPLKAAASPESPVNRIEAQWKVSAKAGRNIDLDLPETPMKIIEMLRNAEARINSTSYGGTSTGGYTLRLRVAESSIAAEKLRELTTEATRLATDAGFKVEISTI